MNYSDCSIVNILTTGCIWIDSMFFVRIKETTNTKSTKTSTKKLSATPALDPGRTCLVGMLWRREHNRFVDRLLFLSKPEMCWTPIMILPSLTFFVPSQVYLFFFSFNSSNTLDSCLCKFGGSRISIPEFRWLTTCVGKKVATKNRSSALSNLLMNLHHFDRSTHSAAQH